MQPTETGHPAPGAPRIEASDVHARPVLAFGGALLVSAGIISVILWGMFGFFDRRAAGLDPEENPVVVAGRQAQPSSAPPADFAARFPQPRLQADARAETDRQRFAEERLLATYGWVNPSTGVVRIPIDRAIELTVERGLPVRSEPKSEQKR
ncbi:MAG: hypothetical protein ACRD2R_04615 [Terriglobales bacterium]